MEISLVKGCMVLTGVIGTTCAVGLPLSQSKIHGDSVTQESYSGGGNDGCMIAFKVNSGALNQEVDFEQLGERISSQLYKTKECNQLFGKTELKQILDDQTKYKWKAKAEAGRDCENETPCGFLELEKIGTSKLNRYKLQISNKDKKEGNVIVVKDGDRDEPSFYKRYLNSELVSDPRGEVVQGTTGEQFSPPNQSELTGGWEKVEGFSIKQSVAE